MKRAKRYIKIILFFWKNSCLGQMAHFEPKNDEYLELWICSWDFCAAEGAMRLIKIIAKIFPKNSCLRQLLHFWPKKWQVTGKWSKNDGSLTSGSVLGNFFKIFTIKGAKNCMEIAWIVFPERVFFGTNRSFLAKEWCIVISLHLLWGFLKKIFTMKGGQGVKESYIKGFSKQVHVLVNGPFWAQNWCIVVTQDFNFTKWGGPKGTWKLH